MNEGMLPPPSKCLLPVHLKWRSVKIFSEGPDSKIFLAVGHTSLCHSSKADTGNVKLNGCGRVLVRPYTNRQVVVCQCLFEGMFKALVMEQGRPWRLLSLSFFPGGTWLAAQPPVSRALVSQEDCGRAPG